MRCKGCGSDIANEPVVFCMDCDGMNLFDAAISGIAYTDENWNRFEADDTEHCDQCGREDETFWFKPDALYPIEDWELICSTCKQKMVLT